MMLCTHYVKRIAYPRKWYVLILLVQRFQRHPKPFFFHLARERLDSLTIIPESKQDSCAL